MGDWVIEEFKKAFGKLMPIPEERKKVDATPEG